MSSINTQIKQLSGLSRNDVTAWEYKFIRNICDITEEGINCSILSSKQVGVIEDIHQKHFE